MRNAELEEAQAGNKIAERNINNLRYSGDATEESEKVGLKFNIQKTQIMASGPITSWQIGGENDRPYFGGSKITADGDCSHEIKRGLLLGRKVLTNLNSILKSRDVTCQQRSI